MSRSRIILYLGAILLIFSSVLAWYAFAFMRGGADGVTPFDGVRALEDVRRQVDFGPRIPGSTSHARALKWLEAELTAAGWSVERQTAVSMGHELTNVIAHRNSDPPEVLVGAHFDTRIIADRDPQPELRAQPGPGANDGASGVAVLLELARTLPPDSIPVWLAFFDAEDNGRIPEWDWILGSRAFVESIPTQPQRMILLDMVGDRDLRIPMEGHSDPELSTSIWATAARLGHEDVFVPELGAAILDDHVPFLEVGIPAVDIIDIDYAYWHTTADTPDKLSSESLQIVGDVLWTWLVEQSEDDIPPGG
jgi:Zn-dependent M28 family amino/carboxypeptidase